MRALLSIKPEYADKIFAGSKRFEFRRRIFGRSDIQTVVVYSTRPVGHVVGEFDIARVLTKRPEDLWEETQHASGISKDFFDSYFSGCEVAHALEIGSVRLYDEPVALSGGLTPPQSYKYLDGQGSLSFGA